MKLFADTHLLDRLHRRERSRIIFVPGNHDVQWDDAQFETLRLDSQKPEALAQLVRDALRAPERSEHRLNVTRYAHVEVLKVKKPDHASRMANVQAFMTQFYNGELTGDSRPFGLSEPGDDWSCHAFCDEGIVFIGLNSCFKNDKYWHGAGFDSHALLAADVHLNRLKRHGQFLVVAVWHHGFTSESGRPDRLSVADLGSVFNMGAHVGLHGHTHSADSHHQQLLNGRMPVIATGSLAAEGVDRPEGTPNQFCTLTIQPTWVRVVLHKLEAKSTYRADDSSPPLVIADDREHPTQLTVSCQRHSRTCEVNAHGIARVTIELEDLRGTGAVPLTIISRQYCGVNPEKKAVCDMGKVEVNETIVSEHQRRYTMLLDKQYAKVNWFYHISNTVALNREELRLLPKRSEYPHLSDEGEDAYSHTVRFPCERLELWLIMERNGPSVSNTRVMVERRTLDGSDAAWAPNTREIERVRPKLTWSTNPQGKQGLLLTVDGPLVGHRYSFVFAPPSSGFAYPEEAAAIAEWVLKDCREKTFEGSVLRNQLTKTLDNAIAKSLGGSVGTWSAHLWHAPDRALLASFGNFRSQGWSTYFEAGTGVAGHAFRYGHIVAWSREHATGDVQTIFRKSLRLPGHRGPEYEWVLCLPIRIDAEGPAIGVIGIAGPDGATSAAEKCERFVTTIVKKKGIDVSKDAGLASVYQQLDALEGRLYATFWSTIASAEQLPQDLRDYANARVTPFVQGQPA